ncbi:MazG-like pyrophosphatase [Acinetobacter phage vB_AbaM_fThrA]|uniref:MazG-like pyrophosphatase n=2 Tax=unclassified bacterial viruses TaxID=12333 RepID=A0AAU8KVJ5_9VIRU|nr:MazG-like pyrophosphatase [Acinetobacter phage vB_AbaM_fThrA]
MEQLIKQIEQWASDRNIIKGSKPIDQAMKLFSEFGELADNVGKGRDIKDDCGDIFIVLTIISSQFKDGLMEKVCNESYLPFIDWAEDQKPECVCNLKDLVVMLLRDLSILAQNLDTHNVSDEVYSCVVCLKRIAELSETTLEECVQIAYDDIKHRKGIMVNGVFIKESDPVYAQVISEIEGNYNA